MRLCVLFIGLALVMSGCAWSAGVEGPRMDDRQLFEALNLEYRGLGIVKAAVDSGDLKAAKHEFAEYLRHRSKPVWRPDWLAGLPRGTRTDKTDTREADRIMQRDLPSVGVYHKFDTQIRLEP